MPIYEYECPVCGTRFERFQHFSDAPIDTCPNGHAGVRRIYSPAGIIFKGAGFYVTDNRTNSDNGRRGSRAAKKRSSQESAEKTKESSTESSSA
jgi:putative FmdB family regulatory protein